MALTIFPSMTLIYSQTWEGLGSLPFYPSLEVAEMRTFRAIACRQEECEGTSGQECVHVSAVLIFIGFGNSTVTTMTTTTSSYDLGELWNYYCAKARGIELDWDYFEQSKKNDNSWQQEIKNTKPTVISLVSLLPPVPPPVATPPATSHQQPQDAWLDTAKQVQMNIDEMKLWMENKANNDYSLSLQMTEREASIIQSTVTSFCAQTANEIEILHTTALIPTTSTNTAATTAAAATGGGGLNYQQHRLGIVQILMGNLKEYITEPWKRWSKLRKRRAVSIWQTPLQCHWDCSTTTTTFPSFEPTRPSHRLHLDFWNAYACTSTSTTTTRPKSIFSRHQEEEYHDNDDDDDVNTLTNKSASMERTTTKTSMKNKNQTTMSDDDNNNDDDIPKKLILQQEAELILQQFVMTNHHHTDLDAVQKMEQMMVNITTLIGQFANLVSEQQEDVYMIHDVAKEVQENLFKGKENLANAKERTRSSQHYMAKGILSMAILLLLMHWLRP